MRFFASTLFACAALALLPAVTAAQDVLKEVSGKGLEEILKGLNIDFTKGEPGKGVALYEFKTKTRKATAQLLSYEGKDLMLRAALPAVDLETVNKHNVAAKFSRAQLSRLKDGSEVVFLESNLDLRGGVSEGAIAHFINQFDEELALWSRAAAAVVVEEPTFKGVSTAQLEKILGDLKIKFNKVPRGEPAIFSYLFTKNNRTITLSTFAGKDLMIDCYWEAGKPDLAKINDWNVKRFFVRAVYYPTKGPKAASYALEANLDCTPGVSESIVRNFITSFDDETRRFEEYLKK